MHKSHFHRTYPSSCPDIYGGISSSIRSIPDPNHHRLHIYFFSCWRDSHSQLGVAHSFADFISITSSLAPAVVCHRIYIDLFPDSFLGGSGGQTKCTLSEVGSGKMYSGDVQLIGFQPTACYLSITILLPTATRIWLLPAPCNGCILGHIDMKNMNGCVLQNAGVPPCLWRPRKSSNSKILFRC